MRNRTMLIALAVTLAFAAGCSGSKSQKTSFADNSSWGSRELLDGARTSALSSMKSASRRDAKAHAERGMDLAERCLMSAPEEPGCYYWRAVNTGLYYKVHIIGYQKGIRRMISDCKKVIELKPGYDHAGAYRILGEIYTQLPRTAGRPDSITRDLDLAEEYLRKAVRLAPSYPENHLALADTLFRNDRIKDALEELAQTKELAPHWRTDASYDDWRMSARDLEKKIARANR